MVAPRRGPVSKAKKKVDKPAKTMSEFDSEFNKTHFNYTKGALLNAKANYTDALARATELLCRAINQKQSVSFDEACLYDLATHIEMSIHDIKIKLSSGLEDSSTRCTVLRTRTGSRLPMECMRAAEVYQGFADKINWFIDIMCAPTIESDKRWEQEISTTEEEGT